MADPVATNDLASAEAGADVIVDVLGNDSDADGDTLTVAILAGPENGTATTNPDNTVTYTPNAGFAGVDSFEYEISDGQGGISTAIATVDVTAVGEATLSITLDGEIQASNYGYNSFLVTNTGTKEIAKVEIDVTNALFPDTVFDPDGLAGDTISKQLRINSDGGTGVLGPDGETYVGSGGSQGYEGIQILFDAAVQGGFQSGETVGFSIDMDPNSIAGADKGILDSGATPRWDVGGVSGAELIGSTFTVTFTDGTTATGQLQGVADTATSNSQGGAMALATQRVAAAGDVSLVVDGLAPGATGSYGAGGPQVIVDGPAGATARVILAKGFLQPFSNDFEEPYASQFQAQLDALAATLFPANNAVEIQVRDILLTGSPQDITSEFNFATVPVNNVADPDQLPLGFVASLVDPSGPGLATGPVTQPIYLTFDTGVNNSPVAIADAGMTDGSMAVGIDVLANDTDDDNDPIGLVSFTQGASGAVTRDDNGTPGDLTDDTLIYTPGAGFSGDSFTYEIEDGQGGTATGTATISGSEAPPVLAANTGLSLYEGAAGVIDGRLLATTDADTGAADIVYTLTSVPARGILSRAGAALQAGDTFTQADIDGGDLVYTHDGSDSTSDDFGFEITDGTTTVPAQIFAIAVDPENDAPVGSDDSYVTEAGAALSVGIGAGLLANDTGAGLVVAEVNGETANVGTEISLASGATVTVLSDGSFDYSPAAGFSGTDRFSYAPGDGTTTSAPVTVSIDVATTAPSAFELHINAGGGAYTAVDGTEYIADAFFTSGRIAGTSAAIANTEDDPLYQTERFGTFNYEIPVENGTYAVTLGLAETYLNAAGQRSFDVEIEDRLVIDDIDIFAVTGGKNIAYRSGPFLVDVTDGLLEIDFLEGIQKQKVNAIDIVRILADGAPPVADDDAYIATEDTTLRVAAALGVLAGDTDPDGDALAAMLLSGPVHGTLTLGADGSFDYVPDSDFFGSDSFTYQVSDGNGHVDQGTVTLTVEPVNAAPAGTGDEYTTPAGAPLSVNADAGLLGNDTDPEGDVIVVGSVEGSAANVGTRIVLASGAALTVAADGSFAYSPAAGQSGLDSFSYTPFDGSDAGDPVLVTIDVAGDAAPEVVRAAAGLDEGGTVTIDGAALLTADADTAPGALLYTVTELPSAGTVTLDGASLGLGDTFTQADIDAGRVSYAHDGSETVSDSFGFDVTDGTSDVLGQNFEIAIAPVNEAPVGIVDGPYQAIVGKPLLIDIAAGLLGNDTDGDGDSLTIGTVEGQIANVGAELTLTSGARLTVNANGSFSYTPAAGYSGDDGFTYQPFDGTDLGAPVAVSLQVGEASPDFALRINAGGPAYTSTDGFEYVADQNFIGGRISTNSRTINNTDDGKLFQSERFGSFDYAIAVGNGTYAVTLDFAETYLDGIGKRIFDVKIEDQVVLDDYDIFAAAGGANIAVSSGPIIVEVTDGELDIAFQKIVQKAKVNAISIVSLTVDGQPPNAVDDSFATDEDTALSVAPFLGLLNNDTDPDGDLLSTSLVSGPANGALTLDIDGSFVYLPDAEFAGTDSFVYEVSDENGNSDRATATITVNPVNDAPVGQGEVYSTLAGTALLIGAESGLLGNDADAEGDPLLIAQVEGQAASVGAEITLGSGASLVVRADGSFDYIPLAGFSGSDSFTYAPGDGGATGAPVTVTIDVVAGGMPQVAKAAATLDEGATIALDGAALLTTDSDTSPENLIYTLTELPAVGSLALDGVALGLGETFTQADVNAGLLSYAHDGSETTSDRFGFDVTDGVFSALGKSFAISVAPVNDAPVGATDSYATEAGKTLSITAAAGLLANDADAEGGLAVAEVEGQAANIGEAITLSSGATLIVNADGSFDYTAAKGQAGIDSFTYTPGDGADTGAPVTVTVSVAPPPPSFELYINSGGAAYTAPDGTEFIADAFFTGGRTYSKSAAIAGTESDTVYQSERYGAFGYDIAVPDGTYTITLDFAELYFDAAGKRVFDVRIEGDIVLDDLDLWTVAPGKNTAYQYVTNVAVLDGNLDIDFLAGVQNPKVNAVQVVSLVTAGEPPVADDDAYSTSEDTTLSVSAAAGVLAGDTDLDSATLSATLLAAPEHGALVLNPDGSFDYTPDTDFTGSDSFTYTVTDTTGNTDEATVTLTVTPVNDAPNGTGDDYTTPSATALSVAAGAGLLANDADVEGDALDVGQVEELIGNVGTEITLDSGARLTVNADGSFDYAPADGFSGPDTFTYAPGDGDKIGPPVTVTVTVAAGAAPEVATNAGITLDEGATTVIDASELLAVDADTTPENLVYTLTAAPASGMLSVGGTIVGTGATFTQADINAGLVSYAHNGSETVSDSFGFSVGDGTFAVPGQSFSIVVDPVNDTPVAIGDKISTAYGTAVNVNVLANDSDADGDPLTIIGFTAPAKGTVTLNDGGTPADPTDDWLSYQTGPNGAGIDSFTYSIADGNGGTATATVTVDVEPTDPIAFSRVPVTGLVESKNYTSLEFGPDGRLYASNRFGEIYAFDIQQDVDSEGTIIGFRAVTRETINLIKSIPNHDDDGAPNATVTSRQVTGILLDGTPENPVIYVSSSDPREGGGGGGGEGDLNLDTNSGVISRLTWTGTEWNKVDLVRGLPRSEENHATNGLEMMVDPETGARTLLIAQGGNTNAGAPSKNFAYASEYALSASILEVDLDRIESGVGDFAIKDDNGQAYVYDIPTVQGGSVFGGADGLNQARIVAGGPVQVYSSGYRNPYDVVVTEDGRVFTIDNGANKGWGGLPVGEGTANVTDQIPSAGVDPDGFSSVNNLDHLEYIPERGYYAGHPNPIRANPDGAGLTYTDATGREIWVESPSGAWPPIDPGILFPEDGDFRLPTVEDKALAAWDISTNGLDEYTATAFQGAMRGNLIAASFDSSIYRIVVDPSNSSATKEIIAEGLNGTPLDVIAQGDGDPFAGTIWIAYVAGQNDIDVLVPTGLSGNPDDFDGDKYSNADELANGTNPNSPSSVPPDFDLDFVSDLGDPDDDNDLLPDVIDHFAIDAANGTDVIVTDSTGFFNPLRNDNPGTGFLGLGFKGWMTNGTTNYLDQYDFDNLVAGGTAGIFTITETGAGDARGALNTQENGFQYGVDLDTSGPAVIKASLLNVFQPLTEADLAFGQFAGIQIGTGDQDNYVKLAVAVDPAGTLDIVALHEENGVVLSETFALDGTVEIGSQVDLYLQIDRAAGTVTPGWTVDGGRGQIGAAIEIDHDGVDDHLLEAILGTYQNEGQDSAMAVGVMASHGTGTPFAAQYDYIDIFGGNLVDAFSIA